MNEFLLLYYLYLARVNKWYETIVSSLITNNTGLYTQGKSFGNGKSGDGIRVIYLQLMIYKKYWPCMILFVNPL